MPAGHGHHSAVSPQELKKQKQGEGELARYNAPMLKLFPLVLALASCMSPPKRFDPGPGPEVLAAVDLMYDDLSSRRWDALEAHFLPNAALVFTGPKGEQSMTPSQFIEVVKKKVEGKDVFEERRTAGQVRAHGDLATVWSDFEAREGNGTDIRHWSGVDAFTLVKVDGRWKVALIAVSLDPPEQKP
jgi:hypothetical protein